jgi:hypothetical protein
MKWFIICLSLTLAFVWIEMLHAWLRLAGKI